MPDDHLSWTAAGPLILKSLDRVEDEIQSIKENSEREHAMQRNAITALDKQVALLSMKLYVAVAVVVGFATFIAPIVRNWIEHGIGK